MSRRWLDVGLPLALSVTLGCSSAPSWTSPPPCQALQAPADAGVAADSGVVWGFADLHAHPATELAFESRLIWGAADQDGHVDATQLPVIQSCPVETHDTNASSPLDHQVGSIVFPMVAKVASYAHAPVGDLSYRPSDSWPNARDVIHQQMNVSAIRRAYEGGLRLMFASTTDDQLVGALLKGPSFLNAFVPTSDADYISAQKQLELIERIVEENESWMGIARTPDDARRLIRNGQLALVLSLEMNGITESQLNDLVDRYGVQHIIPVHLIDNDVGGTAVTSDLFNASSAESSEIYRQDHHPLGYEDVAPTTALSPGLSRPMEIQSLSPPLYANVGNIPFMAYKDDCYEPLGYCDTPSAVTSKFTQLGQINFRGLCTTKDECAKGLRPGAARIAHMMQKHLFVDVSHMGYRSVADTLTVTPDSSKVACVGGLAAPSGGAPTYPLIASHGDFVHLCDAPGAPSPCFDNAAPTDPLTSWSGNERSLDGAQARAIVARHGVLGLGTGTGTYGTRPVLDARGGPLLSFGLSGGQASGCVAVPGSDGRPMGACGPAVDATAADQHAADVVRSIEIQTRGGLKADPANPLNAHPYVRVSLLGPDGTHYQRHIVDAPLACSDQGCFASIPLGLQTGQVQLTPSCDDSSAVTSSGGSTQVTACSPVPAAPCAGGTCAPYTIDHIDGISLEMHYLECDQGCFNVSDNKSDLTCQQQSGSSVAPQWAIDEATAIAMTDGGSVTLTDVIGGTSQPLASIDSNRGSFSVYERGDRPSQGDQWPVSGHLLRISIDSGAENLLAGATTTQAGANVCAALRVASGGGCPANHGPAQGAQECPAGWAKMNQRGAWAKGTTLYAFARTTGAASEVCGVDIAVLDVDPSSPPWTVDRVKVEAIEDPVGRFVRRYSAVANAVAGGHMGTLAFGTDFNGLNGTMDISEGSVSKGAVAASACPVDGASDAQAPQLLAPVRLRHGDGSLGAPVLIEERGLATYGQLADMMAIIKTYPGCGADVYDSLMLSAEATIRTWEAILGRPHTDELPTRTFCGAGTSP
ncbi:MAG: hypothetical protein ACRENE_30780 [Polyangiaceae bacterium]